MGHTVRFQYIHATCNDPVRAVNVPTYLLPWSDRDPPDAVRVRRVAIWETRCRKVSCGVLQGLPTCCISKTGTVTTARAPAPCQAAPAQGCRASTPFTTQSLQNHWQEASQARWHFSG